ncbi:inorganic phosphate transporter [Corynebacterium choanae]|uniref:Phosphate transporter n=1 Tax=Corynebacterium choanae TaxID=1862358 RepID=A0A3G6J8A0_9CORY|nr:inorganic phosphate transporter [Corynebacterium choanae]AZA14216.1 Low-affinity inorganic phosphate transporter 1 [Corynebacterium choanae]
MSTAHDAPPLAAPNEGKDLWWHLVFGGLLAIALIWFTFWSFGYTGPNANKTILLITIVFAVFMSFNIGGNDVANSFGTSVGAGTLTIKQALLVAAVFEVGGAVLAGGDVTDTVRSGIVKLDPEILQPMDFAFIMMSALLGAALWLLIATRLGWPVSTTHSIVGGIVGAAVTIGLVTGTGGWEMVQWNKIASIVASWVISPVLGGVVAFLLFSLVKKYILVYNENADQSLRKIKLERAELRTKHKTAFARLDELQQISYTNAMVRDAQIMAQESYDPNALESNYYKELHRINTQVDDVQAHRALETWVPILAALGSVVIGSMLLFKGLKNLHLGISAVGNYVILGMVAVSVWMAVSIFARTLKRQALDRSTFTLFSWMQVFTASAFAFSHGSNDIANAIGPFAAVIDVLKTDAVNAKVAVPGAAMLTMGIALVSGLWFIGRYVIKTVGSDLTKMHPASGFSAELAAAGVVMLASVLGIPVSSTHILIGAVLGVGVVNRAANWKLMKPIGMAWVITLPVAAVIASLCVLALRAVFG